jgi:hypothetical protein
VKASAQGLRLEVTNLSPCSYNETFDSFVFCQLNEGALLMSTEAETKGDCRNGALKNERSGRKSFDAREQASKSSRTYLGMSSRSIELWGLFVR